MQNKKKFNGGNGKEVKSVNKKIYADIEKLNTEISMLSDGQEDQIDNISNNLTIIENKLENVASKVENLEQNGDSSSEELENLNNSLIEMQTKVKNLSTQVANFEGDLEEVNITFDSFENSVLDLDNNIKGIENNVSSLQTKVNTNIKDISTLSGNISNLTSNKVDKTTTINGKKLSTNITLSAEDVGALPINSNLSSLQQDSEHRTVTDSEKQAWNNKAEKSEIPTNTSELTNDSGFLTSVPSEYVTESELNDKGYSKKNDVAVIESNLQDQIDENKTSITSVGADLTQVSENISGVEDSVSKLQTKVNANIQDISDINTKLTNTTTRVTSAENSLSNVYTKSQTYTKSEVNSTVSTLQSNIDDKYTKPSSGIPKTHLSSEVQASLNKADSALQSVPSTYKTKSENDALYQTKGNYLTSVPDEYVTETELTNKGYATTSQIPTNYATKQEGVYFVDGTGNTTAGIWTGTNDRITNYYDGLVVNFKIGIAGHADGTTLNINGLGAKPCYLRGTTKVTTHYAVGTMVIFVYNASTGAFYSADYDANSYAYVRQYGNITTNGNYPVLFSQNATVPSTYANRYVASQSNFTYNPYSKEISTATVHGTSNLKEKNIEIKRKYSTLFPEGTEIPASANLNTTTYLKVGNYFCAKNADAATLTNCPTKVAFMMQVLSPLSTTIDNETTGTWVYRLRKITTYTGEQYIQYVNSGATAGTFTYKNWQMFAIKSDLATLEENLQDQINENAGNITSIGNELTDLNTLIEGVESSVATLQAKVSTNISDISTLSTNLSKKVDKTTTINGKALSSNITLTASDVGALSNDIVIPQGVKLYDGSGENTDGAVTQRFFTYTINPINLNINDLYNTRATLTLSNVTYPTYAKDATQHTGSGDRVVEMKVSTDGLSWYRKWASGWKECGTTFTITTTWTWYALPIEFNETNYTAVATVTGRQAFAIAGGANREKGRLYCAINNSSGEKMTIYCCGY